MVWFYEHDHKAGEAIDALYFRRRSHVGGVVVVVEELLL